MNFLLVLAVATSAAALSAPCDWDWSRGWGEGGPPSPRVAAPLFPATLSASGPVAAALPAISKELRSRIDAYKARGLDLGMAFGVAYNGQTLLVDGAGSIRAGSSQAPNGDTIFDIASCTKLFTSSMMLQLVESGAARLDDTVGKYFNEANPPVFAPIDPYGGTRRVTLHSLATHTSGLAREAPCGVWNPCKWSLDEIFAHINRTALMYPPHTQAHYSNLGLTLLGRCLERAAGVKYEDWIVSNIAKPLGLKWTGFTFTPEVKSRMAAGYTITSSGKQVEDSHTMVEHGWTAPGGGLYSTINDLLVYLGSLYTEGKSVLGPSALHEYLMPGVTTEDGVSIYGLGTWEMAYANGHWTYTKAGLAGGYGTSVVLIPELKLAMAAFVNRDDDAAPGSLTAQAMALLVPALETEISQAGLKHKLPSDFRKWLGAYSDAGGYVQLTLEESGTDGILNGTVAGAKKWFVWDETQSAAYGSNAMSLRWFQPSTKLSAFSLDDDGDNGVAVFVQQGNLTVSVPDVGLWDLAKNQKMLRVEEGNEADPSTIAMHPSMMEELGLFRGDTVQIAGPAADETVAIVLADETCAQNAVRMCSTLRSNAHVELGESATVRAVDVEYGKRVAVQLLSSSAGGSENFRALLGDFFRDAYRPVHIGDRFLLKDGTSFMVADVEPAPRCVVAPGTAIEFVN